MSKIDDKINRAFLESATSPISLIPFLMGATGVIAMFALEISSPLGFVATVGAMIWGIGTAAYRTFYSNDISKRVLESIEDEKLIQEKNKLEALKYELEREETILLNQVISLKSLVSASLCSSPDLSDVAEQLKELLQKTYDSFYKIPVLNKLNKTVGTNKTLSKTIRDQKLKITESARQNIDFVGNQIAQFHTLGSEDASTVEVRKQLTYRLESAKEFNGQLFSLQIGMSPEQMAQYIKASKEI
jgi:hypothetical protein